MAEDSKVYFGNAKRFLNQFYVKKPGETGLSPIPNWKWGYVIYRTVYTPQSDSVWESVVSKLEAYMLREVDRDLWWNPYMATVSKFYAPIDPSINAEIREHMQNHIRSDKALFDGASLDQVRTYFKEFWNSWYQQEDIIGMPHNHFCIVIDEEVLQSLLDAPEPTRDPNQKIGLTPGFVKVVEKDLDGTSTRGRDDYQGWMKASIIYLMVLFMELQLKDICPYHDEETGDFPIWDTGSPKVKPSHNPDLIGGTQRGVRGGVRNPPPAPQARDTPPMGDSCTAPWLLEYLKKKEEQLTRESDSPQTLVGDSDDREGGQGST